MDFIKLNRVLKLNCSLSHTERSKYCLWQNTNHTFLYLTLIAIWRSGVWIQINFYLTVFLSQTHTDKTLIIYLFRAFIVAPKLRAEKSISYSRIFHFVQFPCYRNFRKFYIIKDIKLIGIKVFIVFKSLEFDFEILGKLPYGYFRFSQILSTNSCSITDLPLMHGR